MDNRPPSRGIPAFIKPFFPKISTYRLKIPLEFTLYMQGQQSKMVRLRDRNGRVWPVKMEKIGNNFFFIEGWEKFVEDNAMEQDECLLFQYDGGSVFDVKLFGSNSCEKNMFRALTPRVEEKNEDEKENNEVEGEKGEEVDEQNNNLEEEKREEDEANNANATETDMDAEYMPKEDDTKQEKVEDEQTAQMSKQAGKRKAKGVKDVHESKRQTSDPCGYDMSKSASIARPKNPYFVTKIRVQRRDSLYVPADFMKDNNLSLPSEIILRDSDGRQWTSELKPWKDGRIWYKGGWQSLCKVNCVGNDDSCICEFMKGADGCLFIQVKIVRSEG